LNHFSPNLCLWVAGTTSNNNYAWLDFFFDTGSHYISQAVLKFTM
jgi:hypothetical protein